MKSEFLTAKYYPVDIRLKIIYNDPKDNEVDCGLGTSTYHGMGTIGIKGNRLSSATMYKDYSLQPALTKPSQAYLQWEKSGFHSLINGLQIEVPDTKPLRPTEFDIIRDCTHTTDGSICDDCLKRATEAAREPLNVDNDHSITFKPTFPLPAAGKKNSTLPVMEWIQDTENDTELYNTLDIEVDVEPLVDPVETALMRLELAKHPQMQTADVALVRKVVDQAFDLRQQLSEMQRDLHRALAAETKRNTETAAKLVAEIARVSRERDVAHEDVAKVRSLLENSRKQHEELMALCAELLKHIKIEDRIETTSSEKKHGADDHDISLLQSALKLSQLIQSMHAVSKS